MVSEYRLSAAFVVRLTGVLLLAVGVLVVVLAVLTAVLGVPVVVLPVGAVVLLLGAVGLVLLARRTVVVRLGETGYTVRYVRGAGVHQAPWLDVEDAVATVVERERCVVLRLRDGSTTTIPVDVLGVQPDDFVRTLQQHLNRGHGYRPLG